MRGGAPQFSLRRMNKPIHSEVVRLQSRIFAGRLKLSHVLSKAEVHRSTWARWVEGAEPKFSTIESIDRAIDALLAQSQTADS